MEYQTPRGLIVRTSITPNPNPPLGTVGPNVGPGFGDTHVMYPASDPPVEVQHWDGWPVGWDTPHWNGYGTYQNKVSVVFACIDLNARIVGSFPIYLSHHGQVAESPLWFDNPAPGIYSSWVEAAEQMIWTYQRRGEIILWALGRYVDGSVQRFAVLNPDLVEVTRDDRGRPAYKLFGYDDGLFDGRAYVADLDPADVCHIKYASWPGDLRGVSPLESVAANYLSAVSAQTYATDLASRGGIPWGVLNAPYELTNTEVDALRAQWLDSAARRGGAPAITGGGFTLSAFSVSPREMTLLESRQFDESRIAVALGVQPYQVGLPQGGNAMTYTNVESLFDFHWRSTLRPFTRKISAAVSAWAFPGRFTKLLFNPDNYVRPGFEGRARTYQTLHGIVDETGRAITAAEIRAIEQIDGDTSVEGAKVQTVFEGI